MARSKKEGSTKVRDEAIDAINAGFKYRSAMSLDDPSELYSHPRWYIQSGLSQIDAAIGGGFYEGKIARWYGPAGSGKTSLLYWSLVRAMGVGATCLYFDPELTFDADRAKLFADVQGIEWRPDLLTMVYPNHLEHLFEQILFLLGEHHPVPRTYSKRPEFKEPLALFVDTVSQCPTRFEYDEARVARKEISKAEGGGMSSRARTIKQEMRKLRKPLALHGATMCVTEQEIASLSPYGPQTLTSGGGGLPYGADVSFRVRAGSSFQNPETLVEEGHWVVIKTEKARFSPPHCTVEIPLYYRTGFDEAESQLSFLTNRNVLKKDKGKILVEDKESGKEWSFFEKNWREAFKDEALRQVVEQLAQKNMDLLWVKSATGSKKKK